jgi:hypothetical protein
LSSFYFINDENGEEKSNGNDLVQEEDGWLKLNTSANVTIKPEVRKTNNTYDFETSLGSFWNTTIFHKFDEEYGSRGSINLRKNLIENMKEQTIQLNENPDELEKCFNSIDILDDKRLDLIPCLAEKAKFEYYSDYRGAGIYTNISNYYVGLDYDDMNETNSGELVSEECWIFVLNWGSAKWEELGHVKIYIISTVDYTILCYHTCS